MIVGKQKGMKYGTEDVLLIEKIVEAFKNYVINLFILVFIF